LQAKPSLSSPSPSYSPADTHSMAVIYIRASDDLKQRITERLAADTASSGAKVSEQAFLTGILERYLVESPGTELPVTVAPKRKRKFQLRDPADGPWLHRDLAPMLKQLEEIDGREDISAPGAFEIGRFTVRLPAFLAGRVRSRAGIFKMRPTSWIGALVQSHLMNHPVLAHDAVLAVEQSNRELAAIGRNINQIARALNEAHFETERLRLDRLAELSDSIESLRGRIRELIRDSRQVWSVE
jgi:hypothetical protein